MCLAIFRPAGARGRIAADDLENSRLSGNDDAYGLMWSDGKAVHTWKTTDKDQWTTFVGLIDTVQRADYPLAAHLRWATHGALNVHNAHPVNVHAGRLALIHNGIIWPLARDRSPHSDTVYLAKYLRQYRLGWHRDRKCVKRIEKFIGQGNKVVVLAANGEHAILNASAGHWENGIWYSNHSYCDWPGTYTAYNSDTPDWEVDTSGKVTPRSSWHYVGAGEIVLDPSVVAFIQPDGTTLCRSCAEWNGKGPGYRVQAEDAACLDGDTCDWCWFPLGFGRSHCGG
jgi:predicted glutamine amidotransferase